MKIEKVEKFLANLHDKAEYVIHIRDLKQASNHRLVLKKVNRIIKSNEKSLVKIIYWYERRFKKKSIKWFWKRLF